MRLSGQTRVENRTLAGIVELIKKEIDDRFV